MVGVEPGDQAPASGVVGKVEVMHPSDAFKKLSEEVAYSYPNEAVLAWVLRRLAHLLEDRA